MSIINSAHFHTAFSSTEPPPTFKAHMQSVSQRGSAILQLHQERCPAAALPVSCHNRCTQLWKGAPDQVKTALARLAAALSFSDRTGAPTTRLLTSEVPVVLGPSMSNLELNSIGNASRELRELQVRQLVHPRLVFVPTQHPHLQAATSRLDTTASDVQP